MRDQDTAMTLVASYALILILAQFGGNTAKAATLQEEQRCLALSLYWEARGEGRRGMIAVGWTVLNRVHNPNFPSTPCAVVRQGGERPPCQFSWWCDDRRDRPRERHSWHMALIIAGELLLDPPPDPTGGALFYHSARVRDPWDRSRIRTARIGAHVFYR
jgi:N-acetylmuramoyl-L-alanine amidase